jgi:Na+-driven multidrug efflux pump
MHACVNQRRHSLPGIFTQDPEVQQLVLTACPLAVLMLSLGWNNALEGCLLAADEQPYTVRVYPWAVGAALALLAVGSWAGGGLPGVWLALTTYYLVLLVGMGARYFVYRGRL